ncbi:putative P-loop containing nucleoside triphosphate hydrolase protein [Lyophyllum shimeji]|uniref:P-loop containing nucleoside triphosphate hydrolase protein n=1 Tax=Lyophyllum shimeji TaxID=47721 RepID=A0A9P3PVP4_LYOSH|nr:putative P-loop containing nucleoside triphosphate hydrolase protein [Lyophyllum shimeji]
MAPPLLLVQELPNLEFSLSSITSRIGNAWHSDHALPVYVAIASAATLFLQALIASKYTRPVFTRLGLATKGGSVSPVTNEGRIKAHGGRVIFAAEVLTLIGSLELLRVSLSRVLVLEGAERESESFSCLAFAYSALLAFSVVVYPRPTAASDHIVLVLATSWIVYFIRDVVPLMTYTSAPADPPYMLRELIGVLSFTAVLLPLIKPHRYIPFDPSDPMPPNPAQTASWLSLLLFQFLDTTVWKAYKIPHLPLTDLPPLADSDHSKNLVRAAFPHLDPYAEEDAEAKSVGTRKLGKPARNFFLAVLTVFRKDVITLTVLLVLFSITTLLSPYGLKQLLEYLGNGGEGATVKPWVWIASLFLAPFSSTLILQQYQMVLARATVHLEAILTQLVLQHALRIRVVAESKPAPSTSTETSTAVPSAAGSASGSGSSTPPSEMEETVSVQAESQAKPANAPDAAGKDTSKSLVGRMNNLISSDLQAISKAGEFLQVFVAGPLLIIMTIAFLYTILGWSALVGAGVLVAQMPIPIMLSRRLQGVAKEVSKKSDDRVETVTETMSVIRMIKMFGWETKMSERIDEKREVELYWVFWNKIYSLTTMNFHFITPAVTMCITFSVYALAMDRTLDAATVFSSIALFDILRFRMQLLFMWVPMVVKGHVSLQRIADFLQNTELLDEFTESSEDALLALDQDSDKIGFRAATFSWSNEEGTPLGAMTPSKRRFRLHIDDELMFKRGCVNLIVGSTGSGKTSLLMALLGEMHFVPSGPGAWFNLPRKGGVAYAAQESWVMNATIKENILFGAPFDEERYNKVIYQCALTRDLELFKAGDLTEVGEKGLTLSGGQKARITLARAVYSSAEILLFDDVLAALDVHTAKWIVDRCFVGDLIQGRTVLLVTHNVSLAAPIAEFVVSLGSDGQILSQGTISDALAKNSKLKLEVAKDSEIREKAEEALDGQQEVEVRKEAQGKLILEEESGEGHISWESVKMYLIALGGRHWMFFWTAFISATYFECGIEVLQPWLLGQWATQYAEHPPEEVDVAFYLTGYVFLVVLMLVVFCCAQTTLTMGALRASASLHKRLIESILGTTLRWLDKTPTSRVITRVTQDVAAVDTTIPDLFSHLFEIGVIISVRFVAVMLYTPTVGLYVLVIFFIGGVVGDIYMKSQLAVKREMSKAKAPVMAHFGASIEGITSIRAYGAQKSILLKSLEKVDNYSRASRVFNDFARWIAVRIDVVGGLFAVLLGVHFVYNPNNGVSTSNSAFTLTLAVGFGRMVLGFVQILNMFEVNGNSLERLQEYMSIEQESKPRAAGVPPAHWPSSGALHVEKLSARYSPDGPTVLHELSFDVRAGERIGIVGRTGSGKSSLTLALLRCIVTEGDVYYDGVRTADVNLDALRSHVTIIPQVPELLSGTLRRNLDPFDQFDDATLNAALRDAGLYSLQNEDDESRLTLDSAIARGGSNLSVGQRQILALARAMVRESKLLVLDEATSAIDYKTDAIIQSSLRTQLGKDVTVITIAHRLQTIMDCDRIMVLDAGRIVEFDRPRILLQKEDGYLRALVDESGDRAALYAAAGAQA